MAVQSPYRGAALADGPWIPSERPHEPATSSRSRALSPGQRTRSPRTGHQTRPVTVNSFSATCIRCVSVRAWIRLLGWTAFWNR
jgi:hypothetical protein